MTGLFAIEAGGSMNYVALCSLIAVWSVGVGGNLPVDSAVFLGKEECLHLVLMIVMRLVEFIPASHQYLTVLSVWWAFGQPLGSLVENSPDRCLRCILTCVRLHGPLFPITFAPLLSPLLPVQDPRTKGGDISCSLWVDS
jgi:hypothetical protein